MHATLHGDADKAARKKKWRARQRQQEVYVSNSLSSESTRPQTSSPKRRNANNTTTIMPSQTSRLQHRDLAAMGCRTELPCPADYAAQSQAGLTVLATAPTPAVLVQLGKQPKKRPMPDSMQDHISSLQLARPQVARKQHHASLQAATPSAQLNSNISIAEVPAPVHMSHTSQPTQQCQRASKLSAAFQPSNLHQPATEQQSHIHMFVQTRSSEVSGSRATQWPFSVNYNDHFETSSRALADIEPVLSRLAHALGKRKDELVIYDPFYCQGTVRGHLAAIGFTNVVHECRDFYADVAAGAVPPHDILVTNPPYSADHKERCLAYCGASGRPWALLLPNYVATKQYYLDIVGDLSRQRQAHGQASRLGSPATALVGTPFYAVPNERYAYEHPEGTGHKTSPFASIWFIHLGCHTDAVFKWLQPGSTVQVQLPSGAARHHSCETYNGRGDGGLDKSRLQLVRTVGQLQVAKHVPTAKRLNPKQRRKMRKLRAQG